MYFESRISHNWLIKKVVNDRVRERLSDMHGTVVDLGCGVAPFRDDILKHAEKYIGVDWGNCIHASRPDIVADLNKPIPIPDATADHVVSFEVIEHLAEPASMLKEAARILRPGGLLTLSAPFQWWEHEGPWDYQRFTRYGLTYQLEKAGFVDIEIRNATGFWSMWLLKLNYQLARLIRGPRWFRRVARALLIPVWWINQVFGQIADKIWREERETAGYFVTARKPVGEPNVAS